MKPSLPILIRAIVFLLGPGCGSGQILTSQMIGNNSFGRSRIVLTAIVSFWMALSALAQLPYVTNLDTAFSLAKEKDQTVVLYTGRSVFCEGKTPRDFFFDFILQKHPEFGIRSNNYVICEQFMFAPNGTNGPTREFMREVRKYDSLYERYHLRVFYPTLTFLDKSGHLVNGPFWSMIACGDWFHSSDDGCYTMLRDYLADDSPMNMDKAQSNLVAAVFPANTVENVCGLFRGVWHTNGGQSELLLQDGLTSREYEIGAPFKFAVREARLDRGKLSDWYDESQVSVTGQFDRSEPFTGTFLVRLNGAWFHSSMVAFGRPLQTNPKVGAREGEHWFVLRTRSEAVGGALLKEMNRLRPQSGYEAPR